MSIPDSEGADMDRQMCGLEPAFAAPAAPAAETVPAQP